MAKLIIWCSGRPTLDGYAKREFKWSEVHKRFVYEGREFTPEEFNPKWTKAFSNNADLQPQVMVVDVGAVAPVAPPEAPAAPRPPVTVPVNLITVDQAEAVMLRLAPERLKAKTGPKAAPKPKIPEIIVS